MSMRDTQHPSAPRRRPVAATVTRALLAAALGLATAFLIACGSSGKGLIPTANAGPLQADFEAVSQAAQTGNGSCTATEAAIAKTEEDFGALPAGIDTGLRNTLRQGISNLRTRALALCTQPLAGVSTATTTKTSTTDTQTTTAPTTPTQTTTVPTTPTGPTETTGTGGGSEAPAETPAEKGNGQGNGPGNGNGGADGGVGVGGQEAGK